MVSSNRIKRKNVRAVRKILAVQKCIIVWICMVSKVAYNQCRLVIAYIWGTKCKATEFKLFLPLFFKAILLLLIGMSSDFRQSNLILKKNEVFNHAFSGPQKIQPPLRITIF